MAHHISAKTPVGAMVQRNEGKCNREPPGRTCPFLSVCGSSKPGRNDSYGGPRTGTGQRPNVRKTVRTGPGSNFGRPKICRVVAELTNGNLMCQDTNSLDGVIGVHANNNEQTYSISMAWY